MRSVAAALAVLVLSAGATDAEDLKAYKLTVDGVTVELNAGESVDVKLSDGRTIQARLEHNEFVTFSGALFSFDHQSDIAVTKSDIDSDITQYLMNSALGTLIVVQEYRAMNPVTLNELMLQQMTKEPLQAGATMTREPASRKLADGKEINGIKATVKTRTESADCEVLSFGTPDQGVVVVTRIDEDNKAADQSIIDKFWQSFRIRL